MTALWVSVIAAAVGCYLLKLGGVSLPESILNHPKVQRVAQLLPIAMLSALVAVELFDGGGHMRWTGGFSPVSEPGSSPCCYDAASWSCSW